MFIRSHSVFALLASVALLGCGPGDVGTRTASFTTCDVRFESMADSAATFLGSTAGEVVASLTGEYLGGGTTTDGALDLRVELIPTDNVISVERDVVVSGKETLEHLGCYDELLVPVRLRLTLGAGDAALDEYIYVRLDEEGAASIDLTLLPAALAGLALPDVEHSGSTSVTVDLDLTDGQIVGLLGFEERWWVDGDEQVSWSALLSLSATRAEP